MATVELHIANEMLDSFEAIRPNLNGHETGRRPSPTAMGITILDMEMAGAPDQAKTMEVVLQLIDGQPKISGIHYWDEHGIFLAPALPFRRAVN
ncbi:hypothetical protein ACF07S_10390 [Streptomyces sp. NPDC016640]|uniref:hypothetical protein n=1 Tax=Streptomyces sp. NPDC016640 TaxID=3364969 RepID=UPI00370100CA